MIYMYDPPSGWQHGWPKGFPKLLTQVELRNELLASGYTLREANTWASKHIRIWEHPDEPKKETPDDASYF